ncbi:MAG: alpha/beta hydrolase family protein, partial [Arenimonas sp.]
MKLRQICLALTLCSTLPFASSAFAADGDASKLQNKTAKSPFLSQSDCFAGAADYDSWLKTLPSERYGQPLPTELVQKMIPPRFFEFAQASIDCKLVSYKNDGAIIYGYVVSPKTTATGKSPILIYNRGGNTTMGAIDSISLFRNVFPLVKAGYTVIASQYRGGTEGDPKKLGRDEFGGRDVGDVTKLLDLSLKLPEVDADNVFMLGVSRGGMMNYLVAKKRPNIRAMATMAGPTDLAAGLKWRPEMENVYKELIPNYENNKQAALESRSALRWAEQLPTDLPVLIVHGDADD